MKYGAVTLCNSPCIFHEYSASDFPKPHSERPVDRATHKQDKWEGTERYTEFVTRERRRARCVVHCRGSYCTVGFVTFVFY